MKNLITSVILAAVVLGTAGVAMAIPPSATTPEIDPGMATGAISVIVGGALILLGRRGK